MCERRRSEYRSIIRDDRYPSIEFIILSHPRQGDRFLERLKRAISLLLLATADRACL